MTFYKKPFYQKGPQRPGPKPEQKPAPQRTSGRYDAPADPAIELPELELGKPFRFDAALAKRLIRRDVNAKEAFTARGPEGAFFRVSVKELSEAGGSAVPYERMPVPPECVIELTLACAVLARQRMLFVCQKATELGVARIVPLMTKHSVPPQDLEHEKAHAWPGQIIRAAKQCRRSSLPELLPPTTLSAFLASPHAQADLSLCLDNVGGQAPPAVENPKRVLLYVGPEGGFADEERKLLEGKTRPWLLGGRVLRAETAVLAGLAAVQLSWGDFRP